MFIDSANIDVRSGKGGDGIIHFRREKFVPFGGPDGGDGGKGGDVILEVNPTLNTLSTFRYRVRFSAENGANGGKNNRTGHSGNDLVIHVPPGTLVYEDGSNELRGDLTDPGERLVIAKGGRGGRGNARFTNSVRQAPRIAEKGEPGEDKKYLLELKLIADVGIIGIPNAGKSTLLAAVSNATPKIGSYPFTTLEPNLGVAQIENYQEIVLADIPGLIEGAHLGAGLGHEFLRHIQRTRVLIHLLDGSAADPVLDYIQINSELALFDPALEEKPQIVVINKMDLPDVNERLPFLAREFIRRSRKLGYKVPVEGEVLGISALTRINLDALLRKVGKILIEHPKKTHVEEIPVYRMDGNPRDYQIVHEGTGWRVSGKAIERAAAMTYWEEMESIRRFQRILQNLGIDRDLQEKGIQPGDTVHIGDFELQWEE